MNEYDFKTGMERLAAAFLRNLKPEQIAQWHSKFGRYDAEDFLEAVRMLEDGDKFPSFGQVKRAIIRAKNRNQDRVDSQDRAQDGEGWTPFQREMWDSITEMLQSKKPHEESWRECIEKQDKIWEKYGKENPCRFTGDRETDKQIANGYREHLEEKGYWKPGYRSEEVGREHISGEGK